jgi:hypothetical protein
MGAEAMADDDTRLRRSDLVQVQTALLHHGVTPAQAARILQPLRAALADATTERRLTKAAAGRTSEED